MKMNKKLLMLGATFAIAVQFDSIATAASVNGTADAVVVAPLTITENFTMDFGTIAPHLTIADVIVMDVAGARNATLGNAQTIGGVGTPAEFTVSGDTAQTFALTLLSPSRCPGRYLALTLTLAGLSKVHATGPDRHRRYINPP